jgi:hypothetical protein
MHLIELDKNGNFTGNKNEFYLNVLSRSRPNAIHGKPTKLISNPESGTMELQAKASEPGTTILWIPGKFGRPVISGVNILSSTQIDAHTGYLITVNVKENYTIKINF